MATWGFAFQTKIVDLEAQLAQKATQEIQSDTKIQNLESDLEAKVALGTEHVARIGELESKLVICQNELREAMAQLHQMRETEIARLTTASDWSGAATLLEDVVKGKEKELTEVYSTTDPANAAALTKALCSNYHQLGELYMKAENLVKAELYTRKAYDERVKLEGSDSQTTRSTMLQLCKILNKTGNNTKIAEAAGLYQPYWERHFTEPQDEFFLECGHELGCLRLAQQRSGEALPLFRRVWEQRRTHSSSSVRISSMSTVEHLISLENSIEKVVVLEVLWAQHTGDLAGAMIQHADMLAGIYWKDGEYTKAEPILAALWAARIDDVQIPANMSNAEKEARLGVWFVTGYRYANTLMKVGADDRVTEQSRDEFYGKARSVLEQLWTARAMLPNTVSADVTVVKLADYYAHTLLYLGNPRLAEEIAGTAWRDAAPDTSTQILDESILYVGEQYAKALNVNGNGKSAKARDMYRLLFADWKELSAEHPRDIDLAASAIKRGNSLLSVLQARGKSPSQCKQLDAELRNLERRLRQSSAPPQRLAIGW